MTAKLRTPIEIDPLRPPSNVCDCCGKKKTRKNEKYWRIDHCNPCYAKKKRQQRKLEAGQNIENIRPGPKKWVGGTEFIGMRPPKDAAFLFTAIAQRLEMTRTELFVKMVEGLTGQLEKEKKYRRDNLIAEGLAIIEAAKSKRATTTSKES